MAKNDIEAANKAFRKAVRLAKKAGKVLPKATGFLVVDEP
jgi:Tfp pilus assembly protein PilF